MEITDEMIKRKRKEFIARIKKAVERGNLPEQGFSPAIQDLRQTVRQRRPQLPMSMS